MATLRPLGQHRLQVMLPNGDTYVPQPVETKVIDAPAAPCSDDWHKNGVGLRCPKCGSTERISS
jgi:hypothetical protein